ncbi:MAG: HTTM domain-containing protein [Labilithrix sp.]|nr:HTTM domain-containing protein [Labilithrix sp.]
MLAAVRTHARRLENALVRPIDVAWLAAYRVLFGLALAVSMERFLAYGWVESLIVGPRVRFHYWGFGWVEPLSSPAMHTLFWVLAGLALAMAAGFAFRLTAPLFAAGLTYIQLIDVSTYLNHYYLAGLLAWLLAISPANRAWSVDAWLRARWRAWRGREADATEPQVAAAWLVLFRAQIGIVYVFAGLAKAQSDWLLHGQPLGIWLGASTHLPVLGRLFTIPGVPLAMSWFGFVFDTTIVLWLSWRRTRPWAYAVVIAFHVLTRLLFDIGMFPIIMSLSALVFFEASWPRALLARLRRREHGAPPPKAADATDRAAASPWRARLTRAALALGALYLVVQVLAPLRCHAYGGNVLWHEQGMRFSWRVMVRAKGGANMFLVRQKETGRVYHVPPRDYLTPYQENEMSGQPDLVLQLAHHIRRDFEARGFGPVEVHVESQVSLNGRRGAPLIDPQVDLSAIEDGLGPATWLLPAPNEPPPPTRPVL